MTRLEVASTKLPVHLAGAVGEMGEMGMTEAWSARDTLPARSGGWGLSVARGSTERLGVIYSSVSVYHNGDGVFNTTKFTIQFPSKTTLSQIKEAWRRFHSARWQLCREKRLCQSGLSSGTACRASSGRWRSSAPRLPPWCAACRNSGSRERRTFAKFQCQLRKAGDSLWSGPS